MPDVQRKYDELLQELHSEVSLLKDEKIFREIHGFSTSEYIENRKKFAKICRDHADHIDKVAFDTGIARTTGGGIGIASGAAVLGGILLAPATLGLSLGLTIGGAAGGVVSAATTITAQVVKDKNLSYDKEKIEEALEVFKGQEEKIGSLLTSIQDNMNKLRELVKLDPDAVINAVKNYGKKVVYSGYQVVQATNAARFAQNLANFIQADFYAMNGIAQGMASPGINIFGKSLIAAGGTAAKFFSGAMGVISLGTGIWDVVGGARDINGSEVAETYRTFAEDYENQTKEIINGIQQLTKM